MKETRDIVLGMLIDILEDHKPSHVVIAEALDMYRDLPTMDRSFIKKLCQGTVERMITEDYIIDRLSSVPVRKQKPVIRNILRMGIYQIAYMNVPDSAACNEAVKLAKRRKFVNLAGFVNGVLRSFARDREKLLDFSKLSPEGFRLSVEYSMPHDLVNEWLTRYDNETVIAMLSSYLTDNKTSVRCNTSKISPEELKLRLVEQGITVEPGRYSDRSFKLSGYTSLESIPEFNEGLFSVQDESSTIAGEAAGFYAGSRVLDLCAAPGGKTLNAADLLLSLEQKAGVPERDRGTVISCDISDAKVALIRNGVERCGFKNVDVRVNDATVFVPSFENAFDFVIADVPCSGLGIIGKKPDIKYNHSGNGNAELITLQRSILQNACRYVRPGGRLIFSTCTIGTGENEDNVSYIQSLGFTPLRSSGILRAEGYIQLLPGISGTDGFFISILIKDKE